MEPSSPSLAQFQDNKEPELEILTLSKLVSLLHAYLYRCSVLDTFTQPFKDWGEWNPLTTLEKVRSLVSKLNVDTALWINSVLNEGSYKLFPLYNEDDVERDYVYFAFFYRLHTLAYVELRRLQPRDARLRPIEVEMFRMTASLTASELTKEENNLSEEQE